MEIANDAGAAATPSSTELATDRPPLAHDRTLMAWVRTATSLISFGFAIYKFFQYLRERQGLEPDGRVIGPRRFAMLMISIGLVSLLLATIQQLRLRKKLKHMYPQAGFPLATIMAAFISLLRKCPTSFQLVEASGLGRLREPSTSWKLVGHRAPRFSSFRASHRDMKAPRNPGVDRGHSSAITLLLPVSICRTPYAVFHAAYGV